MHKEQIINRINKISQIKKKGERGSQYHTNRTRHRNKACQCNNSSSISLMKINLN